MPSSEYSDAARATADLQAVQRAQLTANTPPPYQAWWAAVAGVTHGVGMALATGPLLYQADGAAWKLALLLATIATLSAFPAMCAVRALRMQVRAWPPQGSTRQRLLLEGLPVVAYGVAAVAFLTFGWSVGAITLGVLGGGSLWWREARKNALRTEMAATLKALGRTA
ncbi:hypothetical protein ACFYZJ_37855 [Streptomyces sp. NPDC001848]|uniref:hypothetical protein n=1 Tax=Streptomyces sp. NPDC001848 TaxID=3364618 RepID=UPI00367F5D5B